MIQDFLLSNIIIVSVLMLITSLLLGVMIWVKNTHVTAPNQVAVISGSKRSLGEAGGKVGYRIVTGGRFFLMPVLEKVDFISLNLMTFGVEVHDVPSKGGAPVSVKAVANVKVLSQGEMLALVVERFLGKRPEEIQAIAKENLESNLRSIVGKMDIESLMSDRDKLQAAVLHEAVTDLGKMGLGIDLFNVQSLEDKNGYIKALGETRTAEVKRDAAEGTAKAQQQAQVAVQQARAIAKTAEVEADKVISEKSRETAIVMAENAAVVAAAQAKVPIAGEVAAAEAQATLNTALVDAQKAKTLAETQLQGLELKRKEAELQATVIVTAEKTAQAGVIGAKGRADAATLEGEAKRIQAEKEGLGKKALAEGTAAGRIAEASALVAEQEAAAKGKEANLLADARGTEARLTATARGTEAQLLAEAAGKRATLLAEAEGLAEKAKAMKSLDEGARFLMILEASTPAIQALGHAVGHALTGPAQAIGTGMSQIKEVRVIDMGGKEKGEGSALSGLATLPVETVFDLIQKAKALGFGPIAEELAKKAGFDVK